MQRTILVSLMTGLGVISASTTPALAQTAPAADRLEQIAQQLQALKEQNERLQAEVDYLRSNALAARKDAANEVVKLDTMTAAASEAAKTTIASTGFIDFTHVSQDSNGVDTASTGTGLDVRRFYLVVDHTFDKVWSGQLTTDFNYVPADGETQVYIKRAYLQAKVSDALAIRAGSANTPWVPMVEDLYGYLYVEKVLADRLKFGTSADWGLHAFGKSASGMFNYAVAAVNGGGYKNPSRSKGVDFEGRISVVPVTGLTLAAGFYSGHLGKETQTVSSLHTATRTDALVVYGNSKFRVGAEYMEASNWNQVLTSATDKADAYSLWGVVNFSPQYSAFARFDSAKPSKVLAPALKDTYFDLGLSYRPMAKIDLSLAYKNEKTEHGSYTNAFFTNGGSVDGNYSEFGVWAQLKY
jgi:outer membrane murein-binding lipoprotein Lpp